ncbi:MAG: hypothetical protein ACI9EF_000610 [Pseudohongiellaceae bacterium]|jgi:hypothetical protein
MKRGTLRDAIVGLALTGAILISIEAVFRALDFDSGIQETNISRGFDGNASYLHPDPEVEGGWRTNFFSNKERERSIAPKGSRSRVIMFGGSNTQGFPTDTLVNSLKTLAGSNRFEVINLGRSGYGSARVRIIFNQALELLEPDIVLIYCGHNEFVERGFQIDLEGRATRLSGGIASAAAKTATFQALREHFEEQAGPQNSSPQFEPEAWEWEYEKFAEITYDETLQYYEAYEQNIRGMCEDALAQGVQVMLSTVIYNRLSVPFSSAFPISVDEAAQRKFASLRQQALEFMPPYLAPLLPTNEPERVHAHDWGTGPAHKSTAPLQLASWRQTTKLLSATDRWLYAKDSWKPTVHALDACLNTFPERNFGKFSKDELERAEGLLKKALTICPDHPRALFELALIEYLLDRNAELYVRHFEEANRYDRAPRKASALTTDIILKVAEESEGVHFFDADRAFRDCHPDGLVGWEWMCDHCHLHLGGRVQLMSAFAEAIVEFNDQEVSED